VNKKSVTLFEITIVLVILAVIYGITTISFNSWKEKEDARNARVILKALQRAEWDYFERTEVCAGIEELGIGNPNTSSSPYSYAVICAPAFSIKACRKNNPSNCMTIDKFGEFSG